MLTHYNAHRQRVKYTATLRLVSYESLEGHLVARRDAAVDGIHKESQLLLVGGGHRPCLSTGTVLRRTK